jgi:hypothetical protein
MKHANVLIQDFDLHMLSIACDDLHDYEEKLDTVEENFDIEWRRRRRVHYMAKLYLQYESDNYDQTAGVHLGKIMEVHKEHLQSFHTYQR